MNFDSFLVSPRWEILQILAKSPSSPTELAVKLETTVAYVSQQLKLLDAAGLITKTKTGSSEKGKPRFLFELSKEIIYLAALSEGISEKKVIQVNDYHRTILKLWLVKDSSLHYYFEKLYWKLDENKKEIDSIFLDVSSPRIIVVSDSKTLKSKIDSYVSDFDKKINCSFVAKENIKSSKEVVLLYSNKNEEKSK